MCGLAEERYSGQVGVFLWICILRGGDYSSCDGVTRWSGFCRGIFGCGFVSGFCLMGWFMQHLFLACLRLHDFYQGWGFSLFVVLSWVLFR